VDSPVIYASQSQCLGNASAERKQSPSKESHRCENRWPNLPTDTAMLKTFEAEAEVAYHQHSRDGRDRMLNLSMSRKTHVYGELNNNVSFKRFPRRNSHQYKAPEPHPNYIAQDYELPVASKGNRLSLPSLQEDLEVPSQEVLEGRNSFISDLASISSGIINFEATPAGTPTKMIPHYAEISLYPMDWHQSDPPQRTRSTTCHKVHSFSYSRATNHRQEYSIPFLRYLNGRETPCSSVPTPSLLRKSFASDYEVPIPSKRVQRTQSSKPEQLSMAIQRRNRLTLIREAEGLRSDIPTDPTDPQVKSNCGFNSLSSFDYEESINELRSDFDDSSCKLHSPLQNEVSG